MTLLKAILESNYPSLIKRLNKGDNVNAIINYDDTSKSMLDIAREIDTQKSTGVTRAIIQELENRGALTYHDINNPRPKVRNNLPPLDEFSRLNSMPPTPEPNNRTISKNGIAGVGSRRVRVNLSRRGGVRGRRSRRR
jgi:hypothetical protein